jgi:Tol biopolymer transport system component/tRNA A-37 threonylcarbamoyl transferase component Bud32
MKRMLLTPGSRLGIYEIIAPLGAGGMGEVYRARDTRLGRDVAIKALPPQFAQDPDRLARFEREAKLLASLSHPHIAGIFGLEDIDKHRYLVLEFVEGETLAQRLDRGTLSIDESLQICRQIASALESAHENGIAHRDLKPGNVMITPAGDVKVLDFGLAKGGMGSGSSASDISLSHSPTLTHQHTGAGVIIGTAAYMSPEQARGRTVDKRTDIWSFGCVLYECLTGRQAYSGDTVSDLIARILEREPDWDSLPSRTPSRIRELLKRCLEKDVKQRMRDIGDARIEIDNVIATKSSSPDAVAAAAASHRTRARLRTIAGAVSLIVMTAAATYYGVPRGGSNAAAPVTRFEITEMPGTHMTDDAVHPCISPDGRTLAYRAADSTGTPRVWIRPLESLAAREIPGTDGANSIFWSPDSKYVAYFGLGKLKKVAINGGKPELVCSITGNRGGSWGKDGDIIMAPFTEGAIHRVSSNGGESVAITALDSSETAHRFPYFLPDGKHFLYSSLPPHEGKYRIYFTAVGSKDRTLVLDTAESGVVYAPPGYLIYQRGPVLVAHRFDAKRGRVIGEPVSLGDLTLGTESSGGRVATASNHGDLAYATNPPFATRLVWADMNGRTLQDVPMVPGKYIGGLALSPDDRRVVLTSSDRIGISDLWMTDLERGVITRFSYNQGENSGPVWSRDGTRVAYAFSKPGQGQAIVIADASSGSQTETFLADDPAYKSVFAWSADQKSLVIGRQAAATKRDLFILPLEGDHKLIPYLVTPFVEVGASLSPDGKWLMYESDESGRSEVYVQSFPAPGHKYQVTTRGAVVRGWSRDGKIIGYAMLDELGKVYVADVFPGPEFRVGPGRVAADIPEAAFDAAVTSDQKRLLLLMPTRPVSETVAIIQNWTALLGRK